MPAGPNDVRRDHRAKTPTSRELASRKSLSMSRLGRWGRPQSWATVFVAVLAAIACYMLLEYAS